MSSREHYERVCAIVTAARMLESAERERHLNQVCAGDRDLRSEVDRMMAAGGNEAAEDPFSEERLEVGRANLEGMLDQTAAGWLPEKIGDYTIVRLIGQGGMGVVYEAEQSSPQRRVAIKLLHPMQATPERLRRFRREFALLGRLRHPGIAQIYEASTYDVGRGPQPFFAMELVEGADIRTHCEERGLDRAARIELMAHVADAVQHAHEHGVVHRDLKPDNVLVDERGQPRILDFGIAHTSADSTGLSTALTAEGQLVGTLAYMAPEQLAEPGGDTTPRADVFALGVLCFEILLGRLPRVLEDQPLPQVIASLAQAEPARAGLLDTSLRGDVDTILGKALETDPARRYGSAAAFADDLRRHLANQPIRAHPPSSLYLAQKFVRRHRALAVGVTATLVVALIGAGVATSFAIDAGTAAREAQQRAEELERSSADLLRLSLAQDYEDLLLAAESLWPAHPERIGEYEAWIAEAQGLVAEIPALVSKRDELRALALPLSPEQKRAEREGHPSTAELGRLRGEVTFRLRALGQRRDGQEAEAPEVDWNAAPSDAMGLVARARALVSPGRGSFGQEPLGVALAERAVEVASDEERAETAMVLSRAYFAVGRDDEALGMAYMAMEESAGPEVRAKELELAELERTVGEMRSEAGLAREAEQIGELEERMAELQAGIAERRTWIFSAEMETMTGARWWHNQLTGLIEELGSLVDSKTGMLATEGVSAKYGWGVPRRLAFARRLGGGFAETGEFAARWAEALPDIHAAYPGLNLRPQMGLVPLEADPASELWEFWHVQSGAEPVRGEDGKWVIAQETGLVLVLLPGGKFWMGASTNANGRNHDPDAVPNEGPVHEVEVSAFFLSKYQLTQEQWERMAGANPSRWTSETLSSWIEGVHPVEQVSWIDCMALLPTVGLGLPSEAQWEYGGRAGTETPRPFEFEEFAKFANIADETYGRAFSGVPRTEPWDDGLAGHSPVGSLLPNAFGLHDVIGNLWEWCVDGYDGMFYESSPPVDPVRPFTGSGSRVARGGSFGFMSINARSAIRFIYSPSIAAANLGVRPARAVTR